jgi:hypothetical protein
MFDVAVSRVADGKWPLRKPSAALGFEVQTDGSRRLRWLTPSKEEDQAYVAWVNDNEDSLSMLPAGTLVVCTGKRRTRLNDRVTLSKQILDKVSVRRLSELKTIHIFDLLEEWPTPRLLNDTFSWLIHPALAVLAFGRQTSQPMAVANPKGEFPPLALRIQSARVQYVRNLKIGLEGIDVEPEPRSIFYSSSENLFLMDRDAKLRLRDLAAPLTLLFDREDYLKPAELWLMKVEEATEDGVLKEAVPIEVAIDKLGIEANSLQELFQVVGGETQQIIRSVTPALYAIAKSGSSPLAPYEFHSIISKIADTGNRYDLAEKVMLSILTNSGVLDAVNCSNVLRRIAQEKRDPAEIAKDVYKLLGIDLENWNSAAVEIGSRNQIVTHREAIETFNKVKQDVRWAACGFLQKHLQDSRKIEFKTRWTSYDLLQPSILVDKTWSLTSVQIEQPITEWFKIQAADLQVGAIDKEDLDICDYMKREYGPLGKDPDSVLNDNVKALDSRWQRLRIALASLALRRLDCDAILSQLRAISEEASGKWLLQKEAFTSSFSITAAREDELFVVLCEWMKTQTTSLRELFEGVKADSLEEFMKAMKVSPEDERKAEENLKQGPIVTPKQTIARKSLEVPEGGKPLDDLKAKLDELLHNNNQEILKKLTGDVDIEACANLAEAPELKQKKTVRGTKVSVPKEKDKDFIGYVGEYLIFMALKKRYHHIGLANWVSGNKQKFYPGSQGNDTLGYDFGFSVSGHNFLIEVKSHTGDQTYFDLGSTELDAAQRALDTDDIYQIWVLRNLEGNMEIDRIPNPMDKKNRKHFRFEVGRIYYQTG